MADVIRIPARCRVPWRRVVEKIRAQTTADLPESEVFRLMLDFFDREMGAWARSPKIRRSTRRRRVQTRTWAILRRESTGSKDWSFGGSSKPIHRPMACRSCRDSNGSKRRRRSSRTYTDPQPTKTDGPTSLSRRSRRALGVKRGSSRPPPVGMAYSSRWAARWASTSTTLRVDTTMPRHAKGARLHRHENGIWCIRDSGGYFRSTGTRERGQAETALAEYIAAKGRAGPSAPDQMTVAAALDLYATERARPPETPCASATRSPPWCQFSDPAGREPQRRRVPALREGSGQGARNGTPGAWHATGRAELLPRGGLPDECSEGDPPREDRAP